MRQLFVSLMLGLSLTGPAFAQPTVKAHSLDAVGCMKLRECTDLVTQIKTYDDLVDYYGIYEVKHEAELTALIEKLNKAGVEVYIADHSYFQTNTRGLYYTDVNRMFLNDVYVNDPDIMLSVVRHEGWHAAQDCMAGTIDNSFIAVIHNSDKVPQEHKLMADLRYGLMNSKSVPWEQEAIWAATVPNMTSDALASCSAGRMWETYKPTPLTRTWLQINGFME